jgi:hypothetical protein
MFNRLNIVTKYTLAWVGCGVWGGLGAHRGIQQYNKKYNDQYNFYLKHPEYKKPHYYYLSCFGTSIIYFFAYLCPMTTPICIMNELYNLEESIRGIKNEKE